MPTLRQTHTFAILEVSPEAYREIASLLREAGYDHAFVDANGAATNLPAEPLIDMHGIALQKKET